MHGFRFSVRIENLAASDFLEVVCSGCSRRYVVATWQLHARFRPSLHLRDLERRFVCRGCGARGTMRWAVYRAEPPVREV